MQMSSRTLIVQFSAAVTLAHSAQTTFRTDDILFFSCSLSRISSAPITLVSCLSHSSFRDERHLRHSELIGICEYCGGTEKMGLKGYY